MSIRLYSPAEVGLKGLADVIIGEKNILITFKNEDGKLPANQVQHKFSLTDVPAPMPPKSKKNEQGSWVADVYYVTLKSANGGIIGIRPKDGVLMAKAVGVAHGENELPKPQVRPSDHGDPYATFNLLWEVVGGDWKGSRIPQFLHYRFLPAEDGTARVRIGGQKDKRGPQLADILEAVLLPQDQTNIPFSDNILPELDIRIKNSNRLCNLVLKNGYIENVLETSEVTGAPVSNWSALGTSPTSVQNVDVDSPIVTGPANKPTLQANTEDL